MYFSCQLLLKQDLLSFFSLDYLSQHTRNKSKETKGNYYIHCTDLKFLPGFVPMLHLHYLFQPSNMKFHGMKQYRECD